MLFVALFSVVTMFSNIQATFLLIFPKVFGILTKCLHKSQKNMTNFWYQNQSGFENKWGHDVVDHVRHF